MNTEEDFKREFIELLKKYNVDMSIENDRDGYAEVNFFRYGNTLEECIDWSTRSEYPDLEKRIKELWSKR